MGRDQERDFVRQTSKAQPSVLRETIQWLRHNRKWWLAPIVFGLLVVGVLVVLSGTAVAPFIYTLF